MKRIFLSILCLLLCMTLLPMAVSAEEANYSTVYTFTAEGSEAYPVTGTMSSYTVAYGKTGTLPICKFKRTGYTFAGWTDADGASYANKAKLGKNETAENKTVALKAVWTPTKYTITYKNYAKKTDTVDGTLMTSYTVEDKVVLPTLTRANSNFGGWYFDSKCTKPAVFDETTIGNKTVYAKFTPDTTTYTFEANGGTGTMKDVTVTATKKNVKLPYCTFKKAGYSFVAWEIDGVQYKPGKTLTFDGEKKYTAKAVWSDPIEYTVTFKNVALEPVTYTVENHDVLPAEAPEKEGYAFYGWYFDSKCTKKAEFTDTTTGNKVVYAKYAPYSITYIFDSNEGTGTVRDVVVYAGGKTEKYPVCTFKKTGCKFVDWMDGDGKHYKAGTAIASYSGTENTKAMVFAHWEYINYTISYKNVKNDEISGVVKTYTMGDAVTLSAPAQRTGYKFCGWYDNAKFKGEPITEISRGTSGNKTFYAKWEAKVLTVNLQGYDEEVTIPYGSSYRLPSFTQEEGYEFACWNYGEKTFSAGTYIRNNGSLTENYEDFIVLQPSFKATEYTINYSYATKSEVADAPTTYTIEDAVTLPETIERTGYNFCGWYDNSKFKGEPITEIPAGSTGNKTVYAKWEAKVLTVYFRFVGHVDLPYGSSYKLPSACEMAEGYELDYWECNGRMFPAGLLIKNDGSLTDSYEGEIQFTPYFKPIDYSITYCNVNKGEITDPVTGYTIEDTVTLPVPQRTYYVFEGWYDNAKFEGDAMATIPVGSSGNKCLFAKWRLDPNAAEEESEDQEEESEDQEEESEDQEEESEGKEEEFEGKEEE